MPTPTPTAAAELAVAHRAGLGVEPWLAAARSGTEPHINYRLWGHAGRAKFPLRRVPAAHDGPILVPYSESRPKLPNSADAPNTVL